MDCFFPHLANLFDRGLAWAGRGAIIRVCITVK